MAKSKTGPGRPPKFTAEDIKAVKAAYKTEGATLRSVAAEFSATPGTISKVINGGGAYK